MVLADNLEDNERKEQARIIYLDTIKREKQILQTATQAPETETLSISKDSVSQTGKQHVLTKKKNHERKGASDEAQHALLKTKQEATLKSLAREAGLALTFGIGI